MGRERAGYYPQVVHQKRCRAIFRDETTYSDPHTYNPERYLEDGKLDFSVKDPEETVFGFGRRCTFSDRSLGALVV